MCSHRSVTRWHRFWARWVITVLISFLVPEIYGLVTVGPEATCSAWCWHRLGVMVPCRHTRLGRAAVLCFSAWLGAHLGFGRLGVAPRRRHHN
jgi:hypothetical protein